VTEPFNNSRETKTFDKFGATYTLHLTTDSRKQWTPVHKLPDGTLIDTTTTDWVKNLPKDARPYADWIETDQTFTATYVTAARYQDPVDCPQARPIELFSTSDGLSILGVVLEQTADDIVLLDPCTVYFEDTKGIIKLLPIFNVARTLRLRLSAVRSIQAPAEAIVAIYPGFQIQNKMFKYQLKPRVAVTQTEQLTNDGDAVTA